MLSVCPIRNTRMKSTAPSAPAPASAPSELNTDAMTPVARPSARRREYDNMSPSQPAATL
jgi:hypothetical protein